jgi:hypothetical protein
MADLIETCFDYKRTQEFEQIAHRPHPYEFVLYYDIREQQSALSSQGRARYCVGLFRQVFQPQARKMPGRGRSRLA